jgi:hypothetical protein
MLSVSQCPPSDLVQTVYYFIASGQLKSRTECVTTEALLMAAEDRGPLMHVHVRMMLALHGAKLIPEYSRVTPYKK